MVLQARQGALQRAASDRKAKLDRQLAKSAKASSKDSLVSVDGDLAASGVGKKQSKVLAGGKAAAAKKRRPKLLPWLSTQS